MPKSVKNGAGTRPAVGVHPRSELVERFVGEHGVALLRIARSYAASAVDADDVFQRTLEVMLTKPPATDDARHLFAWAATVARNEALMQHRRRQKIFNESFESIADSWDADQDALDEMLVESERLGQGREALRRLSPDQARCLLLRADGLGYDEIGELTGFSYTKVNRVLTDGRKAMRERVARIDAGSECRRLSGVLSMIADGEATATSSADAQLHLDNCPRCQVTLREFRAAPAHVAAAIPLSVAFESAGSGAIERLSEFARQIVEGAQSLGTSAQERLTATLGLHQGAEMAMAKKLVAVAAVSASLVAGGVTVESVVSDDEGSGRTGDSPAPVTNLTGAPVGSDATSRPDGDSTEPRDRPPREPRARDVQGRQAAVGSQPREATVERPRGDSADPPREFSAPDVPIDDPTQDPAAGLGGDSVDAAPLP